MTENWLLGRRSSSRVALFLTFIAAVSAPSVRAERRLAQAAPVETTGNDWIRVSGELPGQPPKWYWCKASECDNGTAYAKCEQQEEKGDKVAGFCKGSVRLYDIVCKRGNRECTASPTEYSIVRMMIPAWTSWYKFWGSIDDYAFSDKDPKREKPGIVMSLDPFIRHDPRGDKIPVGAAPTLPTEPAPTTPKTCPSEFKRICSMDLSAENAKACFKSAADANKPDEEKMKQIQLSGDDLESCLRTIRSAFTAGPPTRPQPEPTTGGPSQGEDVQKSIAALFKGSVERATVEYLIDSDGGTDKKCDDGKLCGWLQAFSKKNCKLDAPTTECSELVEKIGKDVGIVDKDAEGKPLDPPKLGEGRISGVWGALFGAAKPGATRADEKWIRDLKDGNGLASTIIDRFDNASLAADRRVTQPQLNQFYAALASVLCKPIGAAPAVAPGEPVVGPQTQQSRFARAENLVANLSVTGPDPSCANRGTAAAASDACRTGFEAQATPGAPVGPTMSGPALLCQGGPAEPPVIRPPTEKPPKEVPGPAPGAGPAASQTPPGAGMGIGTLASLSIGAAGGALLGLCLAFGFGWPLFLGALVGAAVGIGVFYLSKFPPWKK